MAQLTAKESVDLKEAQHDQTQKLRAAGWSAMVLVEALRDSFRKHQELEQAEVVKAKVVGRIAASRGHTRPEISKLDFESVEFKDSVDATDET